MRTTFRNSEFINIIDTNDRSVWHFDYMYTYEDEIDENTSFSIILTKENEGKETRFVTYYPMQESIVEALQAHDLMIEE